MKKILLSIIISTVLFGISQNLQSSEDLIGWATYNDLGQNGTTGGGNGTFVRVSTKADLETYAKSSTPYTILVEGSFTGSGMIVVASNKSIIGVGSGAIFDGIGIEISGEKNIIIRNLTIKNANPDAISIKNTHHVWIDHCDLSSSSDGLLDFTIGSNYLTVSRTALHHHDKVALVNSGTNHFEDVGKNKVTYHHNWFYNNGQRNPRIGYGMVHIFNNYYTDISSYCVGYHTGASVLVENNYFLSSASPLKQMYSDLPTKASFANAKETGNIFESTSGNTNGTGVSFDPGYYYDYGFALDSAKDVPDLVQNQAGPVPGLEYDVLPTPANGSIDIPVSSSTLQWTNLDSVTSWEVYFGMSDTSFSKTITSERSFSPQNLEPDTVYFWKVHAILPDTTVAGPLWRFRTAAAAASKPQPADGDLHAGLRQIATEKECSPIELTWKPGFKAASYKVYFGETQTLSESDYKGDVSSPVFDPGPLKYGVKYFWKIVSVESDTSAIEGDTWSFQSDVSYSQEGKTETEDMILNGRAFLESHNGKMVVSGEAGPGTMSSVWSGTDTVYTVSVSYFDENDGTGWYGFYVNEVKIDEWYASDNDNKQKTKIIDDVNIMNGDELRIAFSTNVGELNRTDYMLIEKAGGSSTDIQSIRSLDFPPDQELTVSIYSISGMLLYSSSVRTDENGIIPESWFNEQGIPTGMYIYTVRGKDLPARANKVYIHNNLH